jgi:hypothetical protein
MGKVKAIASIEVDDLKRFYYVIDARPRQQNRGFFIVSKWKNTNIEGVYYLQTHEIFYTLIIKIRMIRV